MNTQHLLVCHATHEFVEVAASSESLVSTSRDSSALALFCHAYQGRQVEVLTDHHLPGCRSDFTEWTEHNAAALYKARTGREAPSPAPAKKDWPPYTRWQAHTRAEALEILICNMLRGGATNNIDRREVDRYVEHAGELLHLMPHVLLGQHTMNDGWLAAFDHLDPSHTGDRWGQWVTEFCQYFGLPLPEQEPSQAIHSWTGDHWRSPRGAQREVGT